MDRQLANRLFVVRAEFGTYAEAFLDGGYIAIGWMPENDFSELRSKDDVKDLFRQTHPNETSDAVIATQAGQISRFLYDIGEGDYVLLPAKDTNILHFGQVENDNYEFAPNDPRCPFPHRKRVKWSKKTNLRTSLSIPFQLSIRASLTIFSPKHQDEFLYAIGERPSTFGATTPDPYEVVLDRILQLSPTAFEILVTAVLGALGFEETRHVGRPGDGGVDAVGVLNVHGLVAVTVFVQVKRVGATASIGKTTVRSLRSAIPHGEQGALITTGKLKKSAFEVASEPGFPRIGLVDGRQFVDLLFIAWDKLPEELQSSIGLKPGLVVA